jgi:hypothetical protein
MIVAAGLLLGSQGATAQTTGYKVTCLYPWCVNYVQVGPATTWTPAVTVYWDEIKMARKLTGATVLWMLVGNPDYEFRANSVVITGTNAAGSATQFPLREVSAGRFALDDLNTNDLTYTYEVRVYKKGSPADAAPIVAKGTIVNAVN